MVTYDPGVRARAADVAALAPRAVITGLSQLDVVPGGARAYVTVGDDDARAFAGRLPGAASRATGLFIEQREALVLTGAGTPEEAAEMIGARVPIVVVSLGADGAARLDRRPRGHGRGLRRRPVGGHDRRRRPVRRRLGLGRQRRPRRRRRAPVGGALRRPVRARADRRGRRHPPRRVHGGGRPPRPPHRRPRACPIRRAAARRPAIPHAWGQTLSSVRMGVSRCGGAWPWARRREHACSR